MSTPYVPPTLEGRVMVELGASLARVRRDYDRALDRIDVLELQLAAARAALAAHGSPLSGSTLSEDVSGNTNPRGTDGRAVERPVGVHWAQQAHAWQLRAEDAFLENTRLRALLELATGTTDETLWLKA